MIGDLPVLEGGAFAALLAAVASGGVTLLAFVTRFLATRPRLPDAGPATMDLGPEPPAVANLLVNRCKVTRSAMGATLLDLAARGILGVEQYGADNFVVRLRRPPEPGSLTDYERRILEHVRDRATGGSAPVEALDLGSANEASDFWKDFRGAVASDARRRGLARRRWGPRDWTVIGGGLAVTLALVAFSLALANVGGESSSSEDFGRWDWFWVAGLVWLAGLAGFSRLRDLRETTEGTAACARWLGVQAFVRESHAFDDLPPAAVILWDRLMAYAAGLGVAHDAVELLRLVPDDPETAWSRQTGSWRELRIEYPVRFGFGQRPLTVFATGFGRALLFGGLAYVALPLIFSFALDLAGELNQTDENVRWLVLGFLGFFSLIGLVLTFHFLVGMVWLVRGGRDLGKRVVVEGQVVQVHEGRFAVDDGHSRELAALIPRPGLETPPRGSRVRVTVSPGLRYLYAIELLGGAAVPAAGAAQAGAASNAVAEALTRSGAEAIPLAEAEIGERWPWLRALGQSVSGASTAAGLAVAVAGPLRSGLATKVFEMAMSRQAAPADFDGRRAWWVGDQDLVVRGDDRLVVVRVERPGDSADSRLAAATEAAREVAQA